MEPIIYYTHTLYNTIIFQNSFQFTILYSRWRQSVSVPDSNSVTAAFTHFARVYLNYRRIWNTSASATCCPLNSLIQDSRCQVQKSTKKQ